MGVTFSDEHKENISKSLKGRKFSEEHRRNLSIAHMKNPSDSEQVKVSPLDNLQSVAVGKVYNTPLFLIMDLSKAHIISKNKFGGLDFSKKKKLRRKDICKYLNTTNKELNYYLQDLDL